MHKVRSLTALPALLLILTLLAVLAFSPSVLAVYFNNRSVTVSSGIPSATANHLFKFTFMSAGNVGSIVFEYCDNSPLFDTACNSPPGLDASSASLTSQTGNLGFSIDGANSTMTKLVLTRAST